MIEDMFYKVLDWVWANPLHLFIAVCVIIIIDLIVKLLPDRTNRGE